jgi:transposase
MHDTLVGVDIAKAVFQLAVSGRPGHFDSQPRLRREQVLPFFAQLPTAVVVMEACGSAHFWARKVKELGHAVVLLPPDQVRPFVKRNKTDRSDAKALVEAYRNGEIRAVPVKTHEQQVLTSLHRLREGWMAERTARLNALRGLLREQGVFIPVGAGAVVPAVRELIGDADTDVALPLRAVFAAACDEIAQIEERLDLVERELTQLAREMPAVARLMTVPGIGLIIATALVAFVGDLRRFASGRHLASYLGLTPREYSSGLRQRLGRISKRGDSYIRMLLVHGARAVLSRAHTAARPDRLRVWAMSLEARAHHNKATVALANKIARIAWAVSVRETDYRSTPAIDKVA